MQRHRRLDRKQFNEMVAAMRENGWDTEGRMRWWYRFDAWDRAELEKLISKLGALAIRVCALMVQKQAAFLWW